MTAYMEVFMDVNNIIANKIDSSISQSRIAGVKSQTEYTSSENAKSERDIKLTKENINNVIDTLNSAAKSVDRRVNFSFNEKTNRVIIKFINGETNEVIREIPPKEMIKLLERMNDFIGMFVDESR
jgi:flagellar protein FlaG